MAIKYGFPPVLPMMALAVAVAYVPRFSRKAADSVLLSQFRKVLLLAALAEMINQYLLVKGRSLLRRTGCEALQATHETWTDLGDNAINAFISSRSTWGFIRVVWWTSALVGAISTAFACMAIGWKLQKQLERVLRLPETTKAGWWFTVVLCLSAGGVLYNYSVEFMGRSRRGTAFGWTLLRLAHFVSAIPTLKTLDLYARLPSGSNVTSGTLRVIEMAGAATALTAALCAMFKHHINGEFVHSIGKNLAAPVLWLRLLMHAFFLNQAQETVASSPSGCAREGDTENGASALHRRN
eukprot:scaffold7842_cov305-Pinguiococcus_pyrenoidosus.AAC.1